MSPRTLSTAADRREEVLEAAVHVFAERGIHGTPTTAVAAAAGISQAYLFRLFATKSELALAVIRRCNRVVYDVMAAAGAQARATGAEVKPAMGAAYVDLIQRDKDLLMIQLHGFAAAVEDPEIRDAMRQSFTDLHELAVERAGFTRAEVGRFMTFGMGLNVLGALGALDSTDEWALAMRTNDEGVPADL